MGNTDTGAYAERDITYHVVDQYGRHMKNMRIQEKLIPATGTGCPNATTWQNGQCVGAWVTNYFADTLSAPPTTGHSEYTQIFWAATPENWPDYAAFYDQINIDAYQSSPSLTTSLIETQNVINVNGNTGMNSNGTPLRRCQ